MDIFGPIPVRSLGGMRYTLVIMDDYSRFTWVIFLSSKDQTATHLIKILKRLQNEKRTGIDRIRSDRGTEFLNKTLGSYLDDQGIKHELSATRTPQQKGIAERRNRTLKEAAKNMIADSNVSKKLWIEAINTTFYTQNRSMINKRHKKTLYEIWNDTKPDVSYFKIFDCKCFIHDNGKHHLTAFDAKADEGIFIGYSLVSRAYRVFNNKSLTVEETIHVIFDEDTKCADQSQASINDLENRLKTTVLNDESDSDKPPTRRADSELLTTQPTENQVGQDHEEPRIVEEIIEPDNTVRSEDDTPRNQDTNLLRPCLRWSKDHLPGLVIGNPIAPLRTKNQMINELLHAAFISQLKPNKIDEALQDASWIEAMQEELNQFIRNKIWNLVPRPDNQNIICTRWSPRAWYDTLSQFLLNHDFVIGTVDKNLFKFTKGDHILLVQIYLDDIIFGSTNPRLCEKFSKLMQEQFEMSMMGELNFFLGLQVRDKEGERSFRPTVTYTSYQC
ncbi:uncharacterized protein [Henckelia pumila]|uniref:uncharacterized protein n=1 Tax=Henckelia pumila TaxID=405737 RepID=UPI003C6DF619